MDIVVYGVALLLLVSVGLFVKAAVFDKRPQKFGLILVILAIPLYLVYFNDRWPFGELTMRDLIKPLNNLEGANSQFPSDPAPALLIGLVLIVHITVFQRVAVRQRLQRVHDPIANFFAGTLCATLVGGILVSTFAWGWTGAVIVAVVFTLVYLGALAVVGAVVEVALELGRLFLVWLKRRVFTVATWITRIASWVSSLSGRLVSRSMIDKIKADTARQAALFADEQEDQDRKLYEAYLRDRARKRHLRGANLSAQLLLDEQAASAAQQALDDKAAAQAAQQATVEREGETAAAEPAAG